MQWVGRGFPVPRLAAWGRIWRAKGQVSRDVLAVLPLLPARANTFWSQDEPQRPAVGSAAGLYLPPLVLPPRNLGKTQKAKVVVGPPPWKGTRIAPEGPCFAFPLGLLGADISRPRAGLPLTAARSTPHACCRRPLDRAVLCSCHRRATGLGSWVLCWRPRALRESRLEPRGALRRVSDAGGGTEACHAPGHLGRHLSP